MILILLYLIATEYFEVINSNKKGVPQLWYRKKWAFHNYGIEKNGQKNLKFFDKFNNREKYINSLLKI